jgi:hypothetical protein
VGLDDIALSLEGLAGADVSEALAAELGDAGSLYAGANATLRSFRLAADYRLNRRDSLIFATTNYIGLSGLVAAGYQTEDADIAIGPSARFDIPVDNLGSVTCVAWQLSWPHFHLRLGVPLSGGLFGWAQAVQAYWVLGGGKSADSP